MKKVIEYLDRQSRWFLIAFALLFLATLGIMDYLTGEEVAISIFYSLPISLLAWFVGKGWGILASILSAMTWLGTDLMLGQNLQHAPLHLWNAGVGLGYFLMVAFALAALKKGLEREKELSRVDNLTGVANGKYFYELASTEIYRSNRYDHPVTLAYLDLDDFKKVNDDFGHSEGDKLLCLFAMTVRENLRQSDIVARLGGDEFAVLLPETGFEQGKAVLNGLRKVLLQALSKESQRPTVTFSIGVLTCEDRECTVDELIKMADALMYSAKNKGKNTIEYGKQARE